MFDFYPVLPRMHLFGNDVMVYVDCSSEETHYVSVPAFTFVTSLCDCWAQTWLSLSAISTDQVSHKTMRCVNGLFGCCHVH